MSIVIDFLFRIVKNKYNVLNKAEFDVALSSLLKTSKAFVE